MSVNDSEGMAGRGATNPATAADPNQRPQRLAALVLLAFVLTFIISRLLVLLIMSGRLPAGLFLHMRGTHVHHLNYGIFLLSGVGAYLLLGHPQGPRLRYAAIVYAIGLGLTFDEFGMWLHLGGPYWQRASFDAVTVVAAILGLIALAPAFGRFRRRHWIWTTVLLIVVGVFAALLGDSFRRFGQRVGPRLQELEERGPD